MNSLDFEVTLFHAEKTLTNLCRDLFYANPKSKEVIEIIKVLAQAQIRLNDIHNEIIATRQNHKMNER